MLTLLRTGPRLPLLLDVVRYFIRRRRLPFVGMHLRYRLTRQFGAPAEYPDWFTPDFEAAFGLLDRSRELSHPRPFSFHAMRPMSCRYYTSVAWQPFLESLDAGVTGLRQDVRLPFIDLRMLEFAFAIPSVPWCEQKELLRSGMQGRLPTAVLARRKAPAAALDPAALHNIAGSAVESWAPPTELANYVMIQRIRRSGVRPSAEMAWLDFRPRLLGTWLQARGKLSNTLLSEGA